MTKVRQRASLPVDAVKLALEREHQKREDIKPIELLKVALSAYLAFTFNEDDASATGGKTPRESTDSAALRRGTQAAVDRLLFNANYWRAAYESRVFDACTQPENAQLCLQALSVWTAHTLKLNTLSPDEAVATFERFCPPFALNRRRGSHNRDRAGKGPLPDFKRAIGQIAAAGSEPDSSLEALRVLLDTMEAEAVAYETLGTESSLTALFDILPAWCLQNRIELVSGAWWDDCAVMSAIIDALHARFVELDFGVAVCQYFLESCYEALDAYHRDLSSEPCPWSEFSVPELIAVIREERERQPSFETDGYTSNLPTWLISKEQLIWNIWVCALYGPASARPLLVDSPDQEYASFASLPPDLRDSSIAYISSIHSKLETLGYEVLPAGSCYPERCVAAFTASEVECLAILEHRRWLRERQKAGWRYSTTKDVERKRSPYLVPWEELPDRAKEWNRSAVCSIPSLLASVNLSVVK